MLNTIANAGTLAILWRTVRRFYRAEGFRAVAYFLPSMPSLLSGGRMHVIHHGFANDVVKAYIGADPEHNDPVPRMVLQSGQPVRWTQIWARLEPSAGQLALRDASRAAGLGDGYSLPVFGPNGRDAVLAVGRAVDDDALNNANIERLHLFAQAAHTRLCALMPEWPDDKPLLSGRETEILDWVARGKSNGVIAQILDLSAGTVDTYLRRIYEKLEVSDRTSAAVRGVGMGLIPVR